MSTFDLLLSGIAQSFGLETLLAILIGVLLGLAVGALPALGPSAGVAIMLPAIVNLEPLTAISALAGMYYGAMYGGSVTSIILGIPGDSAAMMTVSDGYPMAQRGEAGKALGMAVCASFVGGLISIILMTFFSSVIARWALAFGPAEMTALLLLALSMITALGGEDPYKGFIGLGLGLWVGMVGLDPISGAPRFTFDNFHFYDGLDFTIVVVGVYGLGSMFGSLCSDDFQGRQRTQFAWRGLLPDIADILKCKMILLRGALIGFFVGILPGAGATAATVFSYSISKKFSKHPERYGTGIIEGVAAPESANNSASYSAMIPLLTLGIPGSGTTAVMLGGLLMLGMQPGPLLFQNEPDFVWSLIGTFYLGNLMLVFLTIALIPLLASIVMIRSFILIPGVMAVIILGVYSVNGSVFDVTMVVAFGIAGYILNLLKYPLLPPLLGVILGPLLEQNIRRSLTASAGDYAIFYNSVISVVTLSLAMLMILYSVLKPMIDTSRARRKMGG